MKTAVMFLFVLLMCPCLSAQQLFLPNTDKHKPSVRYSYLQLDINYLDYPIRNIHTQGLSINGAAIFNDRLGIGLSLDVTDSKKIPFSKGGVDIANVFEYSQISLYNEVFFHPNSRIDISLPIKFGVGHAAVSPSDQFQFGQTLFSNSDVFDEDYFFVSELGVNVSVHIIRALDFNVGGSYRLTAGANGLVGNDDFLNYSLHAGLRFRIKGKK